MIIKPPEEWLIFENTHEAIIDKETWELVQQIRKTVHRTDSTDEANPLTGLVFCADCGAKFKAPHAYHGQTCFSHYINTNALRELLLETIKAVSSYAISNEPEFIERVRQAAKDLKQKLNKDHRRSAELDGLIKKLYESFATGCKW